MNNAGIAGSAPLKRTTLEEWNRMMAVNATGTFLCTRAFLPTMVEQQWGGVVNVASVAGLHGARRRGDPTPGCLEKVVGSGAISGVLPPRPQSTESRFRIAV